MGAEKLTGTSKHPRVLFYVQHLLGIGHLARASHITQALAKDGFNITLVTGGLPVPGFPGPGVTHIALPPIAVSDSGFAGLVDENLCPVDTEFKARRCRQLVQIFHETRPDIVILEAFPFGRRQVRFELLPLIKAIDETPRRPILISSIRDILQRRSKPERDEETLQIVKQHFDNILVHGDPGFTRLEDSFPLAEKIADRIIYTGLVTGQPPAPSDEEYDVVVSAGGGAVGVNLVRAALSAVERLKKVKSWCVITGPNMPQSDFEHIRQNAPTKVRIERFRRDFPSLLASARLSISQAGYNTVGDILGARCRALLVPFAEQGETEQTDRAEKLEQMKLAVVLPETHLSGENMARAIQQALALPIPAQSPTLQTNGATEVAKILRGLLSSRNSP